MDSNEKKGKRPRIGARPYTVDSHDGAYATTHQTIMQLRLKATQRDSHRTLTAPSHMATASRDLISPATTITARAAIRTTAMAIRVAIRTTATAIRAAISPVSRVAISPVPMCPRPKATPPTVR